MRLCAARQPIPALRLGSSISAGAPQGSPPDRARRAHAEVGRCLTAREAAIDRRQNAGPKVEVQRSRHGCRPPAWPKPESQTAFRRYFPESIRAETALVSDAVQGLGGLDILVSNAARQKSYDRLEDLTTEDFDWTMKTNLYALFWIAKAALPHLQPGAAVICTTSVNAYRPGENLVDYAMTKGAIKIFVEAMAKQVAPRGIRVNGVAPGPFWTPLQISGGQPESKLKTFGADTPLKRPGQPAELAPIYVTLAASDATYITGQIFGASGGTGVPA